MIVWWDIDQEIDHVGRKAEAMSSHLRAVTGEVSPGHGLFIMAEVIDGQSAGSAAEGDIEPPDDQIAAGRGFGARTLNVRIKRSASGRSGRFNAGQTA
ncbi:hypothetical protein ACWDOR_01540 [Streptosporangium canum]|uniref:hypothetical protein n=1 Tax=Streptosporangium canum TaxID=324952 RepID=UPI0036C7FD34